VRLPYRRQPARPVRPVRRVRPVVDGDRGSATIWTAALLGLLASLTSVVLLLTMAIAARHRVERAADESALAAARAALFGLRVDGDPQLGEPCAAAASAASADHLVLRDCACDALDCVVTVEGSVLGGRIPVRAAAQAGPVGESREDQGVGVPIDGATDGAAAIERSRIGG